MHTLSQKQINSLQGNSKLLHLYLSVLSAKTYVYSLLAAKERKEKETLASAIRIVTNNSNKAFCPVSRWLTTNEACSYIKCSRNTLKSWYNKGYIYAKKIKGKWLYDKESIDDFITSDKLRF